jgi:hypothetical protein
VHLNNAHSKAEVELWHIPKQLLRLSMAHGMSADDIRSELSLLKKEKAEELKKEHLVKS